MHSTSLLVAALVLLRHPCTRSQITASLLLTRAAQDAALSPAEREACLNLVDELECLRPRALRSAAFFSTSRQPACRQPA